MYENRFNRTRFGDPLYITEGWSGLPSTVDAYIQIIAPSAGEYVIDTYFFSGEYASATTVHGARTLWGEGQTGVP